MNTLSIRSPERLADRKVAAKRSPASSHRPHRPHRPHWPHWPRTLHMLALALALSAGTSTALARAPAAASAAVGDADADTKTVTGTDVAAGTDANADMDSALAAAALYPAEARWGIFRKGDRIGTHSVRFAADGDDLRVEIESRLRVTLLGIPVFRFDYRASEHWQAGRLMTVDVTVRENGDRLQNALRSQDDRSQLINTDGGSSVPRLNYASNHWHPGVRGSNRVYNTLTGEANEVSISVVGRDTLPAAEGAAPLPYRRYRYTGDITAEAWYDENDRWVGLSFNGEDGSLIEYRLDPAFR